MPEVGDQYKGINNPFADNPSRVDEFTAQEIATLQSRLDKQLGPEYISTRPGAGGSKVHYLAAEKVINLANEVFGFNGWSSAIQNVQIDFVDESQSTGRISLGISIICRVTLKNGTYHEDIGYGQIENCKGKAAAFEKAKKEAATDALKRALRNFGNVLGNCLYDKDYLQKVTKLKVQPSKWDPDHLHRHTDYAPKRMTISDASRQVSTNQVPTEPIHQPSAISAQSKETNSSEFDDDFPGNLFDIAELNSVRPDEVVLDEATISEDRSDLHPIELTRRTPQTSQKRHSLQPCPSTSAMHLPLAQVSDPVKHPPQQRHQIQTTFQQGEAPQPLEHDSKPDGKPENIQHKPIQPQTAANPVKSDGPSLFVSGRAAEILQNDGPDAVAAFNPHSESPSLRRTNGIDHSKSEKISRTSLGHAVTIPPNQNTASRNSPQQLPSQLRGNLVNPQLDANRRIGMPAGVPSPLSNRGGYRPPIAQQKRSYENVSRPPLADLSNVMLNGATEDIEVKRQRLSS